MYSCVVIVDTGMTRILTIFRIENPSGNKRLAIGGYAHRCTKASIFHFTIYVRSNLSVQTDGIIELVHPNMTGITHNTIISSCTENYGRSICRYANRRTKAILGGFSNDIYSNLVIGTSGIIEMVDANLT